MVLMVKIPEDLVDKLEAKLEKIHGTVESLWIEVKDKVFCGKSRCRKCTSGTGHKGPYHYLHYRVGGKNRTVYLGKARSSKLVTMSYDKIYRKTTRLTTPKTFKILTKVVESLLEEYCSNCPLYRDQNETCELQQKKVLWCR